MSITSEAELKHPLIVKELEIGIDEKNEELIRKTRKKKKIKKHWLRDEYKSDNPYNHWL